jgi:hypothetical protein
MTVPAMSVPEAPPLGGGAERGGGAELGGGTDLAGGAELGGRGSPVTSQTTQRLE